MMLDRLLNGVIRFALHQRVLVMAVSVMLVLFGGWRILHLPIDVFPNLNRPRVVVMIEAAGLAPEEVETLITFPVESALNGATGVQAVRSQSGVGLSVIYVEFDWGTDIYNDRQIVAERLQLVAGQLPPGVTPQLAPISSIMGQTQIIGMWSQDGSTSPMQLRTLADWVVRQRILTIPGVSQVFVMGGERRQFQVLVDSGALLRYGVTLDEVKTALQQSNENATGGYLDEQGPLELLVRSLGRVQSVEEIKNIVVTVRDNRPVLVRQVSEVREGPQVKRGDSSAFARLGPVERQAAADRPTSDAGPRPADADRAERNAFVGGPAVLLTINKQPQADTRQVTSDIAYALAELQQNLPSDVRLHPELYQQKVFIDLAVANVVEALRDGGLLVVIVLFLFLLNFRTTLITLTAIPLSIVITALVFAAFGLSINTMTLGGLAVAIGGLVDDAIVDVENIFRRLKENRLSSHPVPVILVVFRASAEIRNSIVFGTMIVILGFLPLFALSGMEGRLFTPLGIAYIVSILSSLVVSLTVTPVLSYWLLGQDRVWPYLAAAIAPLLTFVLLYWAVPSGLSLLQLDVLTAWWHAVPLAVHVTLALVTAPAMWYLLVRLDRFSQPTQAGLLLRGLQSAAGAAIGFSLRAPIAVLAIALTLVVFSAAALLHLERDFLPPFNEGAVQINAILPPGTSLKQSDELARAVERRLQQVDAIQTLIRKTGRAELDEHAVPVNVTEFIASLDQETASSREEVLDELREALADVPGVVTSVEQPLAHLISHMLSGVQAQVAIKIYGDDLQILRRQAQRMQAAIADVPGVTDLQMEPQIEIPQLRIEIDGDQLRKYGLRRRDVSQFVQTGMNGEVVSQVLEGQRTFDLLVRLDEPFREDLNAVKRLAIDLPGGGVTSLGSIANVYRSSGPNTINREHVRRRIVVQCNTTGRGLVDVVDEIKSRLGPLEDALPTGYFVEYGGQFESQQSAARVIGVLFVLAVLCMFLVLYAMFRSANLSLQVMIALPMALIGAVTALYLTGQTFSVAAMVGFVSLCGIASRNGILLINHYLHLVRFEGETWSPAMIIRAGRERVAPVLMTTLTSGIALVPLVIASDEAGKEILYPIATVHIGGLIASTMLEFLVRPALFWMFGLKAAAHVSAQREEDLHSDDAEG
jgi:HME family heavy-metal exporter